MKKIIDQSFINNITETGRYPDAVVKHLHLWAKSKQNFYWIYRFKIDEKRIDMSLGPYPAIGLDEAREIAILANNQLSRGINPLEDRNNKKHQKQIEKKLPTFKEFALDYIEKRKPEWSNKKHAAQWLSTLERFAFPVLGKMKIKDIETEHILKVLTPIWESTTHTAFRLRGRLERILARATVLKLRSGMNPALWRGHLQEALSSPYKIKPANHYSAVPYKDLPVLVKELKEIDGIAALALEFTILNASRTSEVLLAKREEIELDVWTIPAARMKARKEHRVPLCKRSLELIEIAKSFDKDSIYVFSRKGKHLSGMAMLMLLRRIRPSMTVHGFRSCFRDWVSEETMHSPEVAEMALAHTVKDKVEAAYRRGDLFLRRKILMQDWENFCTTGQWTNIIEMNKLKAA
jgi:integrase